MMADAKSAPVVTPIEAFRALLRTIYPENPDLADQITSYHWFHYRGRDDASDQNYRRARVALYLIKRGLRHGRIRVSGVLNAHQSETEVDAADLRAGELHLFDATLDCWRRMPGRIFRGIYFRAEDIAAIAATSRMPATHRYRYPGDRELVEEGRRLVTERGISKLQAAKQLALRAEGGTLEQRTERLRKAI